MQITPQEKLKSLLTQRRFNETLPYPDRQVCITVRDKIVGVKGSYVAFTGLPKAGKSTFLTALIASAFTTYDIYNIKLHLQDKRMAWFDTESSEYDWYKHIDRVKDFAGRTSRLPDKIDAFNVREDDPMIIKGMVSQYLLSNPDCGCLIIDSVLDIVEDFNDPKESKLLTQWLKKITKTHSICVALIMHQAKTNLSTIGHLGGSIDRYANSVIDVSKNHESGVVTMKSKMMRSDADFEPVAIKYYEGKYHEVDPEAEPAPVIKKVATIRKIKL